MDLAGAIEKAPTFTCQQPAFRNAFVNLIAFPFLLNRPNKSDKKYWPQTTKIACFKNKEKGCTENEKQIPRSISV